MNKSILVLAALFGVLGVAMGAFGAHGLEGKLTPPQLMTWETAVRYQMWHVLATLFTAVLFVQQPSAMLKASAAAFLIGVLLFSGSLYLLAAKDLLQLGKFSKFLGPITPIGGLSYMLGWVFLAIHFFRTL